MLNTKFKNFLHNIPMLISTLALLAMNILNKDDYIFAVITFVAIIALSFSDKFNISYIKKNGNLLSFLIGLGATAYFMFFYFIEMRYKKGFVDFSVSVGIDHDILAIAFAVILGLLSMYFLLILSTLIFTKINFKNQATTLSSSKNATFAEISVCLLSAIAVITIVSKSSPIYPFNDWVDSNCFFTVGKSMLSGLVPYRDLLEQKGPVLYMIHTLASLISYKDFFGVYILEVLAATVFLFIGNKILKLYNQNSSLIFIPIMAVIVYSSFHFHHGDSAEEFCLPLMLYSLYCGLKAICFKKKISFIEGFFIGVTSACILWIKFTLLGFYVGWFTAFVIIKIKEKKVSEIFKLVGSVVAGISALSAPVLLYFLLNGALSDLFTVYFYNNLFLYSTGESSSTIVSAILSLAKGFILFSTNNVIVFCCLVMGVLGLLASKRKKDTLLVLLSAITLFTFVFVGGNLFRYYSLILSIFVPMGVSAFADFSDKFIKPNLKAKSIKVIGSALLIVLGLAFSYIECDNKYLLEYEKEDLPQYKFAEIINKEENPTLLNYGFLDGGFYTTTGIVPNNKYFCKLNIELNEMYEGQQKAVDEGSVDFVVTRKKKLNSENYVCVAQTDFFFEEDQTYYLYKLLEE